jgi:hypothetical protein
VSYIGAESPTRPASADFVASMKRLVHRRDGSLGGQVPALRHRRAQHRTLRALGPSRHVGPVRAAMRQAKAGRSASEVLLAVGLVWNWCDSNSEGWVSPGKIRVKDLSRRGSANSESQVFGLSEETFKMKDLDCLLR